MGRLDLSQYIDKISHHDITIDKKIINDIIMISARYMDELPTKIYTTSLYSNKTTQQQ